MLFARYRSTSIFLSLSLSFFLSESEIPQYTLAPNTQCGRCWCEKAPLLNSDSQCTIIPPPPWLQTLLTSQRSISPPSFPLYFSLSIVHPCVLPQQDEKQGDIWDRGWKNKNWGSENANTHLTSSLKAAQSRWQGRQNEVEIHIARRVFKFQERTIQAENSYEPALRRRYLKTMLEKHQRNILTTSTPMLGGIVRYSWNQELLVLYVGQYMSANKSNYHCSLK